MIIVVVVTILLFPNSVTILQSMIHLASCPTSSYGPVIVRESGGGQGREEQGREREGERESEKEEERDGRRREGENKKALCVSIRLSLTFTRTSPSQLLWRHQQAAQQAHPALPLLLSCLRHRYG